VGKVLWQKIAVRSHIYVLRSTPRGAFDSFQVKGLESLKLCRYPFTVAKSKGESRNWKTRDFKGERPRQGTQVTETAIGLAIPGALLYMYSGVTTLGFRTRDLQ